MTAQGEQPAGTDDGAPTRLSLIVSTRGRRAELSRLLASLERQTGPRFEVIVVDQNPPGYLDPVLAGASIPVRRLSSAAGLSLGRNTGLAAARGDLVGFPDDDCWYPDGTAAAVAAAFAGESTMQVLLGRTVDAAGRESLGHFLPRSGPVDRYGVWRAGNSNTLFARRSLALDLAGFDETLGVGAPSPFQSGEETDFTLRALARGAAVSFRHDLLVGHDQVDATVGPAQIRRARGYSRGFGRVLRRHRYPVPYVASRIVRSLGRSAIALACLDPALARYKAAWAWGTLRGYMAGPSTAPSP